MAEKNNKPEIRFKGFSDEWEVKKYSETFTKISNNTLSRAELNYNSGLAKNIHYGDVLIKFGELLDVEKEVIPYITNDSLANKFKASKLQNGDVIIADAAEDETVGKCTELVNIGENTIFSGLHTIPSRPIFAFASGYLGYFMNSPAYHTQLLRLMQGTKVLSISKSVLQDTAIIYPIDRFEQSQLGNFSKQLDHLITLHQQKYNKLATIKKSMLEKMFPQNGAKVPEIRFKGFNEVWEERKLGEVSDSYSGGTPSVGNEEYYGGEIPFIRSAEINSESTELFITEKGLNNSSAKLVNIGYVLYALYGATSGEVGRAKIKGAINQAILAIIPKNDYDAEFIKQWLRKKKKEIISTYLQGGQGNLSGTIVKDLKIDFPCYDEQIKIGKYFKHLDHLLTLEQRDLEKLKNIKKACLEKMFV